ncbi:MAG: competence protein ComEC, partial [Frankiaceae bacterium]|nr:competence protein ComEC [Frankiaceae bacterium]
MTLPAAAAPAEPPDLRLLAPAVAVWATAVAAVALPATTACWLGGTLAVGAVVLALTGRRWRAVLAATLICAAAVAASAGVRTAARRAGPLPVLAQRQARVTAELVLTSDPVQLDGRVVGARRVDGSVFARARLERIESGGTAWQLRQPVVVFASGGGWAERLPGDRIAVAATIGPADSSNQAATLTVRGPPRLIRRTSLLGRVAGRLRAGLRTACSRLPQKTGGLLPGLVDGDTAALDPQLKADFQRTGMTHLVAVSGSNIGFILAAALLLARRIGLGPRTAAVAAGVALAMFVVLVRPSPSVLRAAFMGAIGLFATVTGRERRALSSLFAAVLVLVLFEPSLARSIGFALSTFATLGLLVLAPEFRLRLARWLPGWLADAVAVPLAAQLACTPLIAAMSGAVSLSAV